MATDDTTGTPEGTSEGREAETVQTRKQGTSEADVPARYLECLARIRAIADRITARVRKVADDTGTDLPALPPTDAETVRDDDPPAPPTA